MPLQRPGRLKITSGAYSLPSERFGDISFTQAIMSYVPEVPLGRISSEARISAFLYRYRMAFLASRPHKPTTHLKTKISETDSIIDKEPGWTWSHQWRDSRSECSSGLWFRLGYPRSESPQTTKTLTLLKIPESTAHFGLPSHPNTHGN